MSGTFTNDEDVVTRPTRSTRYMRVNTTVVGSFPVHDDSS